MEERLLTLGDQMAAGGRGRGGRRRTVRAGRKEKIRKKGEDGVKRSRGEEFKAGGKEGREEEVVQEKEIQRKEDRVGGVEGGEREGGGGD